jgi:fido (protein-threonine AMPylation protein)
MIDPLFGEDDDANTPLDAEEREQLIPSYITLRRELNEAEQVNIAAAAKWLSSRRRDVLDEKFLRELHKRMFGHSLLS